MKVAVLPLALSAVLACASAQAANRYLVVYKTEAVPADAALTVAANGGKLVRSFGQIGVVAVSGDEAFAKRMQGNSKVLTVGAEHVFALPDTATKPLAEDEAASAEGAPTAADSYYNNFQWDMRRIHAPAVWARLPVAASVPRVAVLDTGVMGTHPDLAGQLDRSVSTTYCNTVGPDGSAAYPIYSTLIDFNAHPDWSPADGCTPATTNYATHGTHVAGTIAAKFGGGRVVGVAPDAKIGAYKVFDRYRYTNASGQLVDTVGAFDGPLFDAITQATLAGYPVISMSLGSHVLRNDKGSNASWLAWDRIAKWANRNGALVVASAGNSAYDLNGKLAHVPSDLGTVFSTSATTFNRYTYIGGVINAAPGADELADYSNYGSSVDIAAPGGGCPADPTITCYQQHFILNTGINEGTGAATYYLLSGTSMATPHVSAVAAYVRSIHPEWTPGDVRSWLKETAENIGSRQSFGAGMVDADAAAR